MSTQTLATYTSTGISLTTAGDYITPFTITNTGTIDLQSGNAGIESAVPGAYLLNQGSIAATAPSDGVYISNGGTVINTTGATISGAQAVRLGNAGGVVNTGTDLQSLSNAGLLSGTADGVFIRGSLSNVSNTGAITGNGTGEGMYFLGGGSISNAGTFSGSYGISLVDHPGTALSLDNTGTISGSVRGVAVRGTGNVTITNNKYIYGNFEGVDISDTGAATDTLINAGTILSQSFGVFTSTYGNVAIFNSGSIENGVQLGDAGTSRDYLHNSGTITGFGAVEVYTSGGEQTIVNTGTISGRYGVRLRTNNTGSTTIENAGTIASTLGVTGTAFGVYATDGGPLDLIIDPGAVFIGTVAAFAGAANTLELGAGTGTLLGLGTSFTNFGTIAFDTGAAWTLGGNSLGLTAGQDIEGFTQGDTIDLTGFAATTETFSVGVLTLSNGVSTDYLTIAEPRNVSSADFTIASDLTGGTDITICYLRGTLILTPYGETPVEDLTIGDYVITRSGGAQTIKWIGRQTYAPGFIAGNPEKWPVRIAAGALGGGLPLRDLSVSPGHSMLIGGSLILVASLINGITIRQEQPAAQIDYFNIELDSHACVQAEGAWSETYADGPGLRNAFHNQAHFWALYPDYQTPASLTLCAPRPQSGPDLAAALAPIVARASSGITPGPLEGYIDILSPHKITGWARDAHHPQLPVLLDVMLGNKRLTTILACDPRDDLTAAGFARCAFTITFAEPVTPSALQALTIHRNGMGQATPHPLPKAA
jgi:hypothetical protein